MSFKKPQERDGTGPYKNSFQKLVSDKGKRQQQGETCPIPSISKKKTEKPKSKFFSNN